MRNLEHYAVQFGTMMNFLSALKASYDCQSLSTLREKQLIHDLLSDLAEFATEQFNFFYFGFNGGNKELEIPYLHPEVSPADKTIEYPPEHVLATTIQQVAEDLSLIQLVAEQRLLATSDPSDTKDLMNLLDYTVLSANGALWPTGRRDSEQHLELHKKRVLTYLSDTTKMRVMPYSRVALIGLPYTFGTNHTSSYAIPHEVGHFRFWFSDWARQTQLEFLGIKTTNFDSIRLNVRELYYPFSSSPPLPWWAEEIFADVYGLYVAGPRFIETAMERALEDSTLPFSDFDLEDPHPTSLIRPLLMIKALSAMTTPLIMGGKTLWKSQSIANSEEVTTRLFNGWKLLLQERNILRILGGSHIREDLITEFVNPNISASVAQVVDWHSRSINRYFAAERQVLDALFALLNTFSEPITPFWHPQKDFLSQAPEAGVTEDSDGTQGTGDASVAVWKQWVTDKRYFDAPIEKLGEIWAGRFDEVMQPHTRPSNTWLPVFGAGGWTTGPCGTGKHKGGVKFP